MAKLMGVLPCSAPELRPLPRGVRTASKMNASVMVGFLLFESVKAMGKRAKSGWRLAAVATAYGQ
jgi:hypothetical protein